MRKKKKRFRHQKWETKKIFHITIITSIFTIFFVFPRQNCTAGPRPVVSQLKVSALGFEPSLLRPWTALMFGHFLKVWRTGEKLIQLLQLIPWCQYAPWRGWPLLMRRNVRYWRALQGPLLEVFFGFEPHSHSRLFRMRKSPCFCVDPLIIQLNPLYLRTFLTRKCYVTTLQKPGKPLLKITAVITLPSPSDWWHWWLLQKPQWHVTRVTWCNLDMSWWSGKIHWKSWFQWFQCSRFTIYMYIYIYIH